MKRQKNINLFTPELIKEAVIESFVKLNPKVMIKNPVMFTVEIGTVIMTVITFYSISPASGQGSVIYNFVITLLLLLTVLFANFAEAIAEARGKAQAASLRKTRHETQAKLIQKDGTIKLISSSQLKKGDVFLAEAGDIISIDGEIIEGIASIDESAITGESAPVIREAGTDHSGVIGGTKVLSDKIKIQAATQPGETFLDKMIELVEGAKRQKTPNEIALTILLASFTIVFLLVTVTLHPFSTYANTAITIASLISLFVCLIPTTIGGLLSAIGIAGMDRALRVNVIAKSGKAVENAGDIDTVLLDKTGTITIGNRKATNMFPLNGIDKKEFVKYCLLSSLADPTPEGKSIVELAPKLEPYVLQKTAKDGTFIPFTAESRMSGIDLPDGNSIRKGSWDAISNWIEKEDHLKSEIEKHINEIAEKGGTPLVVALSKKAVGVIQLEDIIKPGIKERFARLRKMGVKTVMVTGDNPLTAKFIATQAGVDDFIAEAKPVDKMNYILNEQREGKLVAMMGDGTNDAPALAQADVGVAMNSGTQAAKEASNMVDLDSDPTKLLEVIEIGKQMLITRGNVTTFSIVNDVAKYFAIVPALFAATIPGLNALNIMKLESPESAVLSAVIFNALIIPALIPLALRGVKYKPIGASALLTRNLLIYGLGGLIIPFIGIKLIDLMVSVFI
ncbi:MAG: potassium-transporting ATPase subunit KdpB [Ignavibacteriales bacterium]|nr:MAG: potassium-transporting ATPase subunit KdpB [Ignavibacteriales bacterium]